jgi:RNA polymerase sigma-70 factor (ECF subfamily)
MELRIISAHADAHLSDGALVERALAGDRWAKESIFRRHVAAIAACVTRLLGNRQEVEDVVHDAFVDLFVELDRLRDPEALRGWLMRIAIHKVHRRFRRRRLLRLIGLGSDEAHLAELVQGGTSPEVRAELALVDRALSTLSAQARLTWLLRHVEGETVDAIAALTACSPATVKRRLQAADRRVEKHVASSGRRGVER